MFTLGDKPLLPGELSIENHYRRLNYSRELTLLIKTLSSSGPGPGPGQVRVRKVQVRQGPAQRTQNLKIWT